MRPRSVALIALAALLTFAAAAVWQVTVAGRMAPIHEAAYSNDVEKLRRLLGSGVNPDRRFGDYRLTLEGDGGGRVRRKTALMFAAERGHLEAARVLIDAGADIHARSRYADRSYGEGPAVFDYAVRGGNLALVRLLWSMSDGKRFQERMGSDLVEAYGAWCRGGGSAALAGFLTDVATDKSLPSRALAVLASEPRCQGHLARMLERGVRPSAAALTRAAGAGNAQAVSALLVRGADPDAEDDAFTLLHAYDAYTPLVAAAVRGHPQTVHLLLKAGADPNKRQRDGRTPLIAAVASSSCPRAGCDAKLEVLRLLIAAGADPKARDRSSRNALDYADYFKDDPFNAVKRRVLEKTAP